MSNENIVRCTLFLKYKHCIKKNLNQLLTNKCIPLFIELFGSFWLKVKEFPSVQCFGSLFFCKFNLLVLGFFLALISRFSNFNAVRFIFYTNRIYVGESTDLKRYTQAAATLGFHTKIYFFC